MQKCLTQHTSQVKNTSSEYYVYENTTWVNAKEGDQMQFETETNQDSIKFGP